MNLEQIVSIVEGKVLQKKKPLRVNIDHLTIDSRQILPSDKHTLFIAIEGIRYDAHIFIKSMIEKGVNYFLVNKKNKKIKNILDNNPNNGTFIGVQNTITALQLLATHNRLNYTYPVIGITGSNGKTIVKEWLGQILSNQKKVVKSPKSYNSQIGVPLSVLGMDNNHEVAIIEAGISQPHEMAKLEKIIKPTIGIFTNIGSAHDQSFQTKEEKLKEKLILFKSADKIFYCSNDHLLFSSLSSKKNTVGIGIEDKGQEIVGTLEIDKNQDKAKLSLKSKDFNYHFKINYYDSISIKNVMLCIAIAIELGCDIDIIQKNILHLSPVSMRMEVKDGINNCYLVDDSYSNDFVGLEHALRFLSQQKQRNSKSIIVSDVLQDAREKNVLYKEIGELLQQSNLKNIIGIGTDISKYSQHMPSQTMFFDSTQIFLESQVYKTFRDEIILIKGSRNQQFEKIIQRIEQKVHATLLYINLDDLTNNFMYFKSKLKPDVKLLVMIKALAYGSGSLEVANHLQNLDVDYLGVAFPDEGVYLRQNGIKVPILVMNTQYRNYNNLFDYDLEPEIYSIDMLKDLYILSEQKCQNLKIHVKIETGMNRLGIDANQRKDVVEIIKKCNYLIVKSIFTHMASADLNDFDNFNHEQAKMLVDNYNYISHEIGIKPLKHILKTSGILRFPKYQMDMVRLGIGLHGYTHDKKVNSCLTPIATLKTHISHIKVVKKGNAIGYNRMGKIHQDSIIATLPIGYADGLDRRLSNKRGSVIINGKKASIIGNICMDMCMIDVTGINCRLNDEVIIFGKEQPLTKLSHLIDTIPYEILCSVGNRVKRVYISES